MGNIFINLPAPAGNGAGAWTDCSTMGAEREIVVGGIMTGTVTVEISNEAVASKGAPVGTSIRNKGEMNITAAAYWMRAVVNGYQGGGAPTVNVGANDDGTEKLNVAVTAGNGTGAAADSSAMPLTKTITVGGPFKGSVLVEVSEDAVDYATLCIFTHPGQLTTRVAADRMRVTRSGLLVTAGAGTPLVNVGACDDTSTDPSFSDVVISDSFDLAGRLLLSGEISPAALAANQDNWAPTGFSTAYTIRASGTAARVITGIAGGADGRRIRIVNVGAFKLTLNSLDGASAAGNQFTFPGGVNVEVAPLGSIELEYDIISTKWRPCESGTTVLAPDGILADPGLRFASEATGWYLATPGYAAFALASSGVVLSLTAGGGFPLFTVANGCGIENSGGAFASGFISPAQIAANTNNYDPAGASAAKYWRLSTDASRDLTGIVPHGTNQEIVIMNVGAQDLVIKKLDAGSAAANQFSIIADITVPSLGSASFWYDVTSTKWRCRAKNIT